MIIDALAQVVMDTLTPMVPTIDVFLQGFVMLRNGIPVVVPYFQLVDRALPLHEGMLLWGVYIEITAINVLEAWVLWMLRKIPFIAIG